VVELEIFSCLATAAGLALVRALAAVSYPHDALHIVRDVA